MRATPLKRRPYRLFCCQAPKASASRCSVSASSGNGRHSFCWKRRCFAGGSVEAPATAMPSF